MSEAGRARALVVAGRAALVFAAAGLVLGAATVRVVVSGEDEIAASTAALLAGDPHEAVVRARRAAGWYAPGAPHVRVAYERLVALGQAAEGKGDRDTALFAWRAVRSSSLETRWLVTPHADDLRRANEAIARLEATAVRPTNDQLPDGLEQKQLDALLRDEAPRVPWVVALVVAFAAWAFGGVWAFRRGVTSAGQLALGRAIPGLAIAIGGVLLWLLAVWQA